MKTSRRILYLLLVALLGAAVFASLQLSFKEINTPGSCPSIGPVPACHLVSLTFVSALIGHLAIRSGWGRKLFLVGLGFPTLLALFASIGEVVGFVECPQTKGGIPMCYLSLGLCIVCWIVWFAADRFRNSQS